MPIVDNANDHRVHPVPPHPTTPAPPRPVALPPVASSATINSLHRRHAGRGGQTRFEKELAASGGKSGEDANGDPRVMGPWRFGRTIGKGASGRVKVAKHSLSGQFAAVKIIPKQNLAVSARTSAMDTPTKHDKAVLGLEREIVIMKLIDHPHVMSLYDTWETTRELYLILEFVEGGELFDYLVAQGRLTPDEASRYFQQIVSGVDYCHRFSICHRDLKPENLLLDAGRNIKIADFGMAALEPRDKLLETSCGSPHYASPEIVAGISYHGSASDIWSCGVILFALLTGRLPFDDENIRVLLQKVKSGRYITPIEVPPDARDLISKMLIVDPEKRISMLDVLEHPFCKRRFETPNFKWQPIPEPPRLDLIRHPVKDALGVNRAVLRNLKSLWGVATEEEIVDMLLCNERTWEKAFYVLLDQYREKHGLDDSPKSRQRDFLFGEGLRPFRAAPTLENIPEWELFPPRGESDHGSAGMWEAGGHEAYLKRRYTTAPKKDKEKRRERDRERELKDGNGARKARKAAAGESGSQSGSAKGGNPKPNKSGASPPRASRPAPPRPAHVANKAPHTPGRDRRSVIGPRPPGSPSAAHSAPPPSPAAAEVVRRLTIRAVPPTAPVAEYLPQITLQSPTPQGEEKDPKRKSASAAGLGLHDVTVGSIAPPPSPSPSPTSPSSHAAAMGQVTPPGLGIDGLSNISVPKVENAELQKFFHDIAEHLQKIGHSPRSSIVMDGLSGTSSTSTPHQTPKLTGEGTRQETPPMLAIYGSAERPKPIRANSDQPRVLARAAPEKRRSYLGEADSRLNAMPVAPAPTILRTEAARKSLPAPKSNSMKRKTKPAPLDLSPRILTDHHGDGLLSPADSPYLVTPTLPGGPPSPLLVGPSTQKNSWYSTLFGPKATFTLISADDCASSRSECIKLLESFGASVLVEDADGWGILKVKLDDIRDVSGVIIPKSVKLRIEFLPQSSWAIAAAAAATAGTPYTPLEGEPPSPAPGTPRGDYLDTPRTSYHSPGSPASSRRSSLKPSAASTSLTMIFEKGHLAAFKAVYGRIRSEWRLDSLNSPALSSHSKFKEQSSPTASPGLYPDPTHAIWS